MKGQMMNLQVVTKANDVDAKGRVKVAVNRTGIEDAQGDISMPGSFDKTLREDLFRMKWLYNHDVTQLLGVPLEGSEQNGDVVMVGQLNMDKQLCRDVYTDYKLMAQYGRTLEHSVGVIPIKRNKDDKRMVEEWKMLEYSTLSFLGANPCTYLVDIKSATPSRIKEAVDFLQSALKEPTYSDYRLKSLDMNLQLLLRKLDGGRVVTCPYCGEAFDYDMLIFFSPTGIKSLQKNFPNFEQGDIKIGCFGVQTAKAVTDAGLRLDIEAPTANAPSMTAALEQYLKENNK